MKGCVRSPQLTLKEVLQAYIFSGNYLKQPFIGNYPLWYLPLYFLAFCAFFWMRKLYNKYILVAIIALLAIITLPVQGYFHEGVILSVNALCPALVFMGIGYLFHSWKHLLKNTIYLELTCLLLGIFISMVGTKLGVGGIGAIRTPIYYFGACVSSLGFYLFAQRCQDKLLSYIGEHSLLIYGLHLPLISATDEQIATVLGYSGWTGIAYFGALTAIVITMGIIICKVVDFIKISYTCYKYIKIDRNTIKIKNID